MTKKLAFKTKAFAKWMKKTGLKDQDLVHAIFEMENGLIDADIGGNVFKKRVALPGMGKRASTRTLVASTLSKKWFFLFGYLKNEKDNISNDELLYLQEAAKRLLSLTERDIEKAVFAGELLELVNHDK